MSRSGNITSPNAVEGNESRIGAGVAPTLKRKPPKNSPGARDDVGWKHCVSVDNNTRVIKCNYCEKVMNGGVYRLKHHLARTGKDVGMCRAVPDDVQQEMLRIVSNLQETLIKKSKHSSDDVEAESNDKDNSSSQKNIFKRGSSSQHQTINTIFKKELREDACQAIASFFYNNAISFNVARSEEFPKMFELVARHGLGFKPPSYHEIRVKYLKQQVNLTKEVVEVHRNHWKEFGCTIITDGWTDKRRRTILNFLVNSPKGTVFLKSIDASQISKTADKIYKMIDEIVEDVGEENVIQVVTDNAANYKAAGELLMEKRQKLYWTPCAAHCIDLMLEDFEKKIPIHKETIASGKKITTYIYGRTSLISMLQNFTNGRDLVRPAATRFATAYLTLGCLNDNKGALLRMFTFEQWKANQCAKTRDGKHVEDLITDKAFWKSIVICLKGAFPLIKVLRLVDSDEKPAMGFIYEEMDRAKEKIQSAFNNVRKSYLPLWEIIDHRWDSQLHRPLHAAGYYLNPRLHYNSGFKADYEVKKGLYDCLQRIVGDIEEISKIDTQLEEFKSRSGLFGSVMASKALNNKTPAQWWESYGSKYPELMKFAIRVLSLTCSSSGCERNWSAFEMVHTKRRNRLKQKTMNDVVFVMANSKLGKKKQKRTPKEYDIDDLPSDDDWILDDEDAENFDVEMDSANEDGGQVGEGTSGIGNTSATEDEDLQIPSFEDDELEENEDNMADGDDYYDQNLNVLLNP